MSSAAEFPPPPDEAGADVDGSDSDGAARLDRAQRVAAAAHRARLDAEQRADEADRSRVEVEQRLEAALAELERVRRMAPEYPGEKQDPPLRTPAASDDDDDGVFALFQDPLTSQPSLTADGSDPGVLPIALGGTALVGLMIVVITTFNGRLLQPFGFAMVAITAALAYFAWQTRVERINVQVSQGGVVYIERSSSGSLRFDLRSDSTLASMSGQPGTSQWGLSFARASGADSFTVTPAMVDSVDFSERVRAFRPDL